MKKHLLQLVAFLPFFVFAGNGPGPVKPVKKVSNTSPSVNYQAIQHAGPASLSSFVTPSPFLSLKSGNPLPAGASVTRDPKSGMPIMIDNIPYAGNVSVANNKEALSQVITSIAKVLGIHSADEFEVLHTESDQLGMTHIKLEQKFKGIPVYGSQAWIHFAPNGKACFTGRTQMTPALVSILPGLAESRVQSIIKDDVSKVHPFQEFSFTDEIRLRLKQYQTELVVLPSATQFGKFNLAYHVTVRPNVLNRWEYYIDANTGAILNKYDNTCSLGANTAQAVDLNGLTRTIGTFEANSKFYMLDAATTMYTGTQTSLPGAGKGIIITLDAQNTGGQNLNYTEVTSNNNVWNNPRGVSAHFNAKIAWDYFKNTFGRNSINGNGGDVVSFINVADANGGGLDNAYWNGQYMFYGNGNTHFTSLAGGLDVGGHEMTHGVVQETANLEYQGESGAMNESFADVFGTLIEGNNWKLGEDVVVPSQWPSGCMRDMQNPHNGGSSLADNGWQPSHMNEKYNGTQDNGGVHINSGIANHAYYLIANTIGKGPAQLIYYRALSLYLTKSSQFIDLRLAIVRAAEDLHGAGSSQVNTVKQSFDAVGIGNGSGTNTTPTLPTNPGTNKLLIINLDGSDANTLYLTDDNASAFTPISTTAVTHKPSVSDDGSYALFVGSDHNIYGIMLTSPYTETQFTTDAYWGNVAISKDGNRLAAVSQYQDTSLWVYDLGLSQWGRFHLYNPTTAQGVDIGGVLYADALEWAYDGSHVMYDAYNKLTGSGGQTLDYWDIGFLRVWNLSGNSFGDGEIFKAYNSLDEGISVGNPTFAKNSPYIIAFDYINSNTSTYSIFGANLETNETGLIYQNLGLGVPSYSPQDNKIAFNATNNQSEPILAFIDLDQTKITGNAASAVAVVLFAGYANWYGTGNRVLPSAIDVVAMEGQLLLYPNPALNSLNVVLPEDFSNGALEVYNVMGAKVFQSSVENSDPFSLDVSSYSSGNYLIRIHNASQSFTQRFEKW